MIVDGNILGDVVRNLISNESNITRVRWSGGATNPTGESEGKTPLRVSFRALVTQGKSQIARKAWGELADDEAVCLLDAEQLGELGVLTPEELLDELREGDIIEYRSQTYEIKGRRMPDLDAGLHFLRIMIREVQHHGDV